MWISLTVNKRVKHNKNTADDNENDTLNCYTDKWVAWHRFTFFNGWQPEIWSCYLFIKSWKIQLRLVHSMRESVVGNFVLTLSCVTTVQCVELWWVNVMVFTAAFRKKCFLSACYGKGWTIFLLHFVSGLSPQKPPPNTRKWSCDCRTHFLIMITLNNCS